jgi:hypothetical protein
MTAPWHERPIESSSNGGSPKSGERQTVQLPSEWHRSLIKLAAKRKQRKIWAMCRLIGAACDAEGVEHPPYPWEEMEANG